jgi:hypothetical protein
MSIGQRHDLVRLLMFEELKLHIGCLHEIGKIHLETMLRPGAPIVELLVESIDPEEKTDIVARRWEIRQQFVHRLSHPTTETKLLCRKDCTQTGRA